MVHLAPLSDRPQVAAELPQEGPPPQQSPTPHQTTALAAGGYCRRLQHGCIQGPGHQQQSPQLEAAGGAPVDQHSMGVPPGWCFRFLWKPKALRIQRVTVRAELWETARDWEASKAEVEAQGGRTRRHQHNCQRSHQIQSGTNQESKEGHGSCWAWNRDETDVSNHR